MCSQCIIWVFRWIVVYLDTKKCKARYISAYINNKREARRVVDTMRK